MGSARAARQAGRRLASVPVAARAGMIVAGEGSPAYMIAAQVFEQAVVFLPTGERGAVAFLADFAGRGLRQEDDAFGVGVGERVQQQTVEQAETRRVATDAGGEGEDDDKGESGGFAQAAPCVDEVLP